MQSVFRKPLLVLGTVLAGVVGSNAYAFDDIIDAIEDELQEDVLVGADTNGQYFVDEVNLDGDPWTGADTVIKIGRSYAIDVVLSYDASTAIAAQEYTASPSLSLFVDLIDGDLFANVGSATELASDTTDDGTILGPRVGGLGGNRILDGDQVNTASWLLTGEARFDPSFGGPGVYDIVFARDNAQLAGLGSDGLFPRLGGFSQQITVDVPAPASILLLGAGLLGFRLTRKRIAR